MTVGLFESYRNRFPFPIGAPSYVVPGDYRHNIRIFGPDLDAVELLFFESHAPPSRQTVKALLDLQNEIGIRYTMHLPTDVSIGEPENNPEVPRADPPLEAFRPFLETAAYLSVETATLHLGAPPLDCSAKTLTQWQHRATTGVQRLLEMGVSAERVSVENLRYPFEWVDPVLQALGLSVCIDTGHVVRYGYDLESIFNRYLHRAASLHLHGVKNGRDHTALCHLPDRETAILAEALPGFRGIAILEVFSVTDLTQSLQFLTSLLGIT